MIEQIRSWCEYLIVGIFLSIIIEMMIPNGNNKKYVKTVIGIYIMFISLNPIIELLNFDFSINDISKLNVPVENQNVETNIRDVFKVGIENSIKIEIEQMGYTLNGVLIDFDKEYEDIEKIELVGLKENNKNTIECISIGENKEIKDEYKDIIDFISTNYSVSIDKIFFR